MVFDFLCKFIEMTSQMYHPDLFLFGYFLVRGGGIVGRSMNKKNWLIFQKSMTINYFFSSFKICII